MVLILWKFRSVQRPRCKFWELQAGWRWFDRRISPTWGWQSSCTTSWYKHSSLKNCGRRSSLLSRAGAGCKKRLLPWPSKPVELDPGTHWNLLRTVFRVMRGESRFKTNRSQRSISTLLQKLTYWGVIYSVYVKPSQLICQTHQQTPASTSFCKFYQSNTNRNR